MSRPARRRTALGVALVAVLAAAGCGGGSTPARTAATTPAKAAPLRLGTKNFTEQYVLGELYAQALRAKGFDVVLKGDIGSTEIIDEALSIGSIDLYPEYTGVVLSEIAGERAEPISAQATYARARAFQAGRGNMLTRATPFTDSNALAVTPATAERYGLHTIADLAKIPGGPVIGAPPEFRTRFEGLVGLQRRYGLTGVRTRALKIGEQYRKLESGEVDVAAVFTTDGNLQSGDYVVLRDPRRLFGFQNVAPVVRRTALARAPGLQRALDTVSATLTTTVMRRLNADVDLRGEDPKDVAHAFLQSAGLA
jgi:osmoprotectant transport system substrate-binding protein